MGKFAFTCLETAMSRIQIHEIGQHGQTSDFLDPLRDPLPECLKLDKVQLTCFRAAASLTMYGLIIYIRSVLLLGKMHAYEKAQMFEALSRGLCWQPAMVCLTMLCTPALICSLHGSR